MGVPEDVPDTLENARRETLSGETEDATLLDASSFPIDSPPAYDSISIDSDSDESPPGTVHNSLIKNLFFEIAVSKTEQRIWRDHRKHRK